MLDIVEFVLLMNLGMGQKTSSGSQRTLETMTSSRSALLSEEPRSSELSEAGSMALLSALLLIHACMYGPTVSPRSNTCARCVLIVGHFD